MDNAHLLAPDAARALLPLIAPALDDMGFALIRIYITQQAGKQTVQIMAEREDGSLSIADCEMISRALSALLDVEDPIAGEYVLEISSPGMARPLTRARDFDIWAGYEANIKLRHNVSGQKRFRGVIDGFHDGEARLSTMIENYDTPQILGFRLGDIAEARLVISDNMMRNALKRQKQINQSKQHSA